MLENLVWEQKYRPKKIDDVILPATTKKMIKDSITSGKVPNFLFAGSAGTGKTTTAYAIANELGADILFINASLEGNMDTLRTKISQFVSTVSFTDSKKVVLLDECDYLSTSGVMPALRGFLDTFSDNAIFIFTCNYPNRLIDPLLSRLTRVDFKFSKEETQPACVGMLRRICQILETESVEYDKKAVASLVTRNFPDFRRTLVDLQRYSAGGVIDSGILATIDETGIDTLVDHLRNKKFTEVRQWIANNTMDAQHFYRLFYDKVSPYLVPMSVPQMILLIADSEFKASHSVDPEINQVAFCIQFMQSCAFK
jgi:DNA polymerase III delta prime subunit